MCSQRLSMSSFGNRSLQMESLGGGHPGSGEALTPRTGSPTRAWDTQRMATWRLSQNPEGGATSQEAAGFVAGPRNEEEARQDSPSRSLQTP